MTVAPARWAVYAVPGMRPEDGPLAARMRELGERALERTVRARRYGWHATLKAPFRTTASETDVVDAVAAFAASRPAVVVRDLGVRDLGGFWALTPCGDTSATDALASATTIELDRLRAPTDAADLARRNVDSLTRRQRELLAEWGYPYVLDEFRWHFTLTDAAEPDPLVRARLERDFAEVIGADVPLTALTLLVEPEPGADFRIHSVHALSEEPA